MNKLPFQPFSVPFKDHLLKGDQVGDNPSVLFLHGAGQSTRMLFRPLQEALKVPSVAFDFIGHGETGGVLEESSLKEREEQVRAVVEATGMTEPLSIVAASMSGYTAIKLLEKYEVARLVLFVPAVYAVEAYDRVFNQGFSEIIRRPRSWVETDAWRILKGFKGDLLMIKAGYDDVIPDEVIERLYEAAGGRKELLMVKESPHKILNYLSQHPVEMDLVCEKVRSVLFAKIPCNSL